jgi:hypothetical protein
MTTMLPGWGTQVGQIIGAGYNKLTDPNNNAEFQQEFQKKLLDPTSAKAFADMYARNPNGFDPKRYGAQNLQMLQSITQTNADKLREQITGDTLREYQGANPERRAAIGKGITGIETPTETSITSNTAKSGSQTIASNQIKLDHEVALQNYFNKLSPKEQVDRLRSEEFRRSMGVTEQDFKKNTLELQNLQDQADLGDLATKWVSSNEKIAGNPLELAKQIKDGKIDLATSSALMSDPKYGPILGRIFKDMDTLDEQNFRTELQRTGINAQGDRQDKSIQAQVAGQEALQTNRDKALAAKIQMNIGTQLFRVITSTQIDKNELQNTVIPTIQQQEDELAHLESRPARTVVRTEGGGFLGLGKKYGVGFKDPGTGEVKNINTGVDINSIKNPVKAPSTETPNLGKDFKAPTDSTKAPKVDSSVADAIKMIDSKGATLDQALSDESTLTPEQKQMLKDHYKAKTTGG